jgi:hypothetical protein
LIDEHLIVRIEATLANFGNPPYGTTLTTTLVYPTSDTNSQVDNSGNLGCEKLEPLADFDVSESFAVSLDRGECSFVTKARHA